MFACRGDVFAALIVKPAIPSLWPDDTVSFAVLDLDLSASALAELRAAHGDDIAPLSHPDLRAHTRRLLETARSLGLTLFPEDSGGRGVHLWLFLETRRSARATRAALSQVLVGAGPQPADVTVEVFPRQERIRCMSPMVPLGGA